MINIKKVFTHSLPEFLFGRDLWRSRFGVMAATTLLTIVWFAVDWCMATTFRPMSDWLLWAIRLAASFLALLPYVISRRVWVQTAWLAVLDCLMIANVMYSRTYFAAIPPDNYMLAGNLGDFTASITDSLRWSDAMFPIILACGCVCAYSIKKRSISRLWQRYLSLTAITLCVAVCGIAARGSFYNQYDRLVQSCYYSTCGVPTYTLAGHIAYGLMEEGTPSPQDKTETINWISDHDKELGTNPVSPDKARKNLVLIILESFESWPIGAKIDGIPVTPYLDSLSSLPSTFFAPNMLTQVASGRSIDCQLLINAGLLPPNGSVYSMKYPHSTYLTLNKALKQKYGSKSIIFTADKPITWNQAAISRAFGYDSLIDRRAWRMDEMIGNPAKLSDGSFLTQAVNLIKSENLWPDGKPAMLTFITYSGHNPFIIPQHLNNPELSARLKDFPQGIKHYIEAARYTDSQLHILIDYLQSRSDAEQTLIVITGDHEGLAALRRDAAHSPLTRNLVSPGQYTPLIILNAPTTGKYDGVLGQIDVYPTLLDMLGLDDYPWRGLGYSLLRPGKTRAAISSMTGAEVGDLSDRKAIDRLRQARHISDIIIRGDVLNQSFK